MGVSKLSAKVFLKVNYSFEFHHHSSCSGPYEFLSSANTVLQVTVSFSRLLISSFSIITGGRIPREALLGGRSLDEYTTSLQRGEFRNGRVEDDGDLAVKTNLQLENGFGSEEAAVLKDFSFVSVPECVLHFIFV